MTVPIDTSEVTYTGNGVTDTFSTGFYFLDADELRVYLTPVGGSPGLLVEGSDYTVTMPGAVGENGSVVVTPAPAVGEVLTVRRTVPITQLTNFRGAGSFSPAVHEDQFDELVFIDQQLDRRVKALESAGAPGAVVAGDGLAFVDPTTLAVGAGAGIAVNADTVEVLYGAAGSMVQVRAAAASAGVQDAAARVDHRHDVYTSPPGAGGVVAGGFATEGVAQGLARADHTHEVLTAAPVAVTKAAAVEGVAGTFARSDHKHDVSTAAAIALTDATNAEGSATTLARSDHTHAHGVRGGGTLHAEATAGSAGFMPAAIFAALTGAKASRTHLRAWQAVLQAVPTGIGGATIIFDTEEYDTVGEYNAATGIFTAVEDGYYLVTAGANLASAVWAAPGLLSLTLMKNGATLEVSAADYIDAALTRVASAQLSTVVLLTAGQTLQVIATHNQGGPVNTVAARNTTWLTIDRIL